MRSIAGAREHVNDRGNSDEVEDLPPEEVGSANGENDRHDPFFLAARSVNSLSGQHGLGRLGTVPVNSTIIINTISFCHRHCQEGARKFAIDD